MRFFFIVMYILRHIFYLHCNQIKRTKNVQDFSKEGLLEVNFLIIITRNIRKGVG